MKKLIAVASALCLLACNKKENETTKKFEDFSDYEAPNPKLVNDKQGVKEVTAFMFDNYYVHDKGINGAQLIRDIDVNLPDEEFYNQISNVFAKHGDAHTRFFKPKPFSCRERGIISDSLLFDLANENGNLKLVVNHINFYNAFSENLEYISALAQFEVGDVILSINGEDPIKMIESNSHFSYGANNESKNIFGLRNLLFRKEVIYPKLIENEFKIKIMRNNLEINLPVYSNNECKNEEINSAIGWDLNHYNMMHYFKNESFQNIDKNSEVKFYKFELNENTKYLYILVPSFASEEVILNKDDNFVIRNMLSIQYKIEKQNDINGVLIDVRNNPGGLVEYSDLLAQLFYSTKSNNPFYPMEFYMKANNENLKVLNRFNKLVYEKNDDMIYIKWIKEMKRAIQSGDKFIKSLPITEKETLDKSPKNLFPKSENKKVIILTNAACYSACDAFVALMKDQNLTTKIIGEQKYTGGGGANVLNWNKMQKHKVFDYEFENSMDMNFSWRAMQSRLPDGTYRTIEGKGTEVDCVIPKTVDDIKFSNPADIVKNRTYVERILQNIDNDTLCVNK